MELNQDQLRERLQQLKLFKNSEVYADLFGWIEVNLQVCQAETDKPIDLSHILVRERFSGQKELLRDLVNWFNEDYEEELTKRLNMLLEQNQQEPETVKQNEH